MPEPDALELIGGREPGPVVIVDHDPAWLVRFEHERARIGAALPHAAAIDHVGSTSVPGLPAKPVVDIQLSVADLDAAITALEAAGYELRVREPGHRMLRTPAHDVHIHLWADSADETRHLLFRDWLRVSAADRELYAETKRRLAAQTWDDVNDYAQAKSPVISEITARAEAWDASAREQ
jgi:GrpB-like predicted nucleotidyltransferase (UPF0157 family)